VLDVTGNRLTVLPEEVVAGLRALVELRAGANALGAAPEALGACDEFEELLGALAHLLHRLRRQLRLSFRLALRLQFGLRAQLGVAQLWRRCEIARDEEGIIRDLDRGGRNGRESHHTRRAHDAAGYEEVVLHLHLVTGAHGWHGRAQHDAHRRHAAAAAAFGAIPGRGRGLGAARGRGRFSPARDRLRDDREEKLLDALPLLLLAGVGPR
jgi:hypothetical protein